MKTKNKIENFKLALDKESNRPVTIQLVDRGLKCNAICADCKQDFVAAKGEKNKWHFRHSVESDCKGGQETALHLLAKVILCRNSEIQITKQSKIQYTNPIAEIKQEEYRPDVTAKYGEEDLFIEVFVTNPLTSKKANHFISNEIKSIVIDLSKYEFDSELELEKYIIENVHCKKIVFWTKAKQASWIEILSLFGFIGVIGFLYYKFGYINNKTKPSLQKSYKPKYKSNY
jgi:hypothetical protein